MQDRTAPEQPAIPFSHDVYLVALAYLPRSYEDRWKVATCAGYMAACGDNIAKLARAMDCGRYLAKRLMLEAKRVLEPVAENFLD